MDVPRPSIREILKHEYSAKQSWNEFKNMLKEVRTLVPLFTLSLSITKMILYAISWLNVYSSVEPFITNVPNKTIQNKEIWRLLFAPYETTSFWSSLLFTVPIYTMFYLMPKEKSFGTCYAFLYFNLISKSP